MLLSMLCTVIPDADVLAFTVGIPYEHPFGHRGFTHSILFALLLSLLLVALFFREKSTKTRLLLGFLFFIATLSHGLLDSLTTGGLGVNYFFPFDNSRYFFPWRPIRVSPIGISNFFSARGMAVIKSELLWIGLPAGLLWLLSAFRKVKRNT